MKIYIKYIKRSLKGEEYINYDLYISINNKEYVLPLFPYGRPNYGEVFLVDSKQAWLKYDYFPTEYIDCINEFLIKNSNQIKLSISKKKPNILKEIVCK